MKIDLQIQTTCSDGFDTPKEIIAMAQKAGVKFLSITDHNTFDGVQEAIDAARGTDISVVPGIEITCEYKEHPLHILGYNVDVQSRIIAAMLETIMRERREMFQKALIVVNQRLLAAHLPQVDPADYENLPDKFYSTPGLATFLHEKRIVSVRNDAYKFIEGTIGRHLSIAPYDVIQMIHEQGGVAVLSHPLRPKISLFRISQDHAKQDGMVHELVEAGLDGFECYNPGHSPEDIARIKAWATKYDLHITAGSDWHGIIEKVGNNTLKHAPHYLKNFGDLEVPDSEAQEMIDWLKR